MSLYSRLRVRTRRVVQWAGPRADDPLTAAIVVGVPAYVFSFLYYGSIAVGQLEWALAGQYGRLLSVVGLFVLTVVNAWIVPWAVWWFFGLNGVWSYWRGGVAGFSIGVVSHVTLGPAVTLFFAVVGSQSVPSIGLNLAVMMAIVAVYSVVFTVGIPIVLSTAAGLFLTYARKQTATGEP